MSKPSSMTPSTGELIRAHLEQREQQFLAPRAQLSSARRLKDEQECPLRTAFQRDSDRIVHCKAFRRLKHKTQVFLSPTGDHYRTRLRRTLGVSQIARTIGRVHKIIWELFKAFMKKEDVLMGEVGSPMAGQERERQVFDFIAGMTDRYALDLYKRLFLPRPWMKL